MKKIAGILICIALALGFTGCSWQIPEKVSVKTNAEYNFSLGNFKSDFSEQLDINKMLGDLQLPNNGKVYDYWPNKNGDSQKFLMYMPIQEIPIDISSYFDSSALGDQLQKISFEKEFEVPEVSFSFPVKFELDKVNEEINKQFILAGMIQDYNSSQFGAILKQIADTISYSKGTLVVKAYTINGETLASLNNGSTSIQESVSDSDIDTSYYGNISITSGGKSLFGYFRNGIVELTIPESGFDFKADDINISFTNKPTFMNVPSHVFVAKIDSTRPYQIKSVSGIGSGISINKIDIDQDFDALQSLKDSGVEECRIGTGKIDIDFDLPAEWKNVQIAYSIEMSGGINVAATEFTASAGSSNNVGSISLNGKDITAEKINVKASFLISIAGATIDFTKPPAIGFDSSISNIERVTAKLSDTNLSFAQSQKLPDEVLAILKQIELKKCGIKGTYTNTLPTGNDVTLSISSDFFGLSNKAQIIKGGVQDESFELATSNDTRTINLSSANPLPEGMYNAFDFNVDVTLPGGAANKVTIEDVSPGQKYKLAINVEPIINWESVTIDTKTLPEQKDTVGTGFNPSTIFNSINDVLGEGFADNIELPDCKLYLYLTVPELDVLKDLDFSQSSISMFYGKSTNPSEKIGTFQKDIIKDGKYEVGGETKSLSFAKALPSITVDKLADKTEVVTSTLNADDASFGISISDLFKSKPDTNVSDSQLCISYDISLANKSAGGGVEGFKITNEDFETATSGNNIGSIGIYAVIELPLEFTVKGGTEIDVLQFMNQSAADNDRDLFGRTSADSMAQIAEYADVIESVQIDYKINSFPVVTSEDIQIKLDLSDDSGTGYVMPKLDDEGKVVDKIAINTSVGSEGHFKVESDDIENLLEAYPLKLKTAKLYFEKDNTISIPREKKIDVNLQIGLKTDGTIPLFGNKE